MNAISRFFLPIIILCNLTISIIGMNFNTQANQQCQAVQKNNIHTSNYDFNGHGELNTNQLLNEQNSYLLQNNQSLNEINGKLSMENYGLHHENQQLREQLKKMEHQQEEQNQFYTIIGQYKKEFIKNFQNKGYCTGLNHEDQPKPYSLPETKSHLYLVASSEKYHNISSNHPEKIRNKEHKLTEFSFQNKISSNTNENNREKFKDTHYNSKLVLPKGQSMYEEDWKSIHDQFYYYAHRLQKDNYTMSREIHMLQRQNNKQIIIINDLQQKRKKMEKKYEELELEISEMQNQLIANQNQYHLMQLLLLAIVQWSHKITPIPVEEIKKIFKRLINLMAHDEDLDLEYPELMFNTILNLEDVPSSFFPILRLLNEEDYIIKLFDLGFFQKLIIKEINDDINQGKTHEIVLTETCKNDKTKDAKPIYYTRNLQPIDFKTEEENMGTNNEDNKGSIDSRESLLKAVYHMSTNINYKNLAPNDQVISETMEVEDKSRKISLKNDEIHGKSQDKILNCSTS